MTLQTVFDGATVAIAFPDDTAEAARQAVAAAGSATAAALSTQAALAAARYYATIAAGVAATTTGQMFTSDEGGTWSYYLRTGSSPFYSLFREVLAYDSSGNLGIGTPTPGAKLDVVGSVRFQAASILLSNTQGVRWGTSDQAFINGDDGGGGGYLIFGINSEWMRIEYLGTVRPGGDNAQTLGSASFRWSTVYAATGSINTSDARLKTWRGALTSAELAAARRIVAELGFYQWTAEVAEKGPDGARYHFGPRAQAVAQILIDEGVEAEQDIDFPADQFIAEPPSFRTAFLCFDTWQASAPRPAVDEVKDQAGKIVTAFQPGDPGCPAGNRFGLRLDQLILFLIAAQEARLAALEAAAP